MPSSTASALVIGGGIVGLASALALQECGWRTTLIDDAPARRAASLGNAGHIATEQVEPLASPAALRSALRRHYAVGGALDLRRPLRHRRWIARYLAACTPARFRAGRAALRTLLADALPAWRRLVQALDEPSLLVAAGHWVCWESAKGAARGRGAWEAADTGTAAFATLDEARLDRLRSLLDAPVADAIAFSGSAQISDLDRLMERLVLRFTSAGGELRRARIHALASEGGRVHALDEAGARLQADRVLVCAGIGSRALLDPLGLHVPLIAERGYHLHWPDHGWPELPPVVFEQRSMILTRFAGGLRAAGFVEFAEPDAPADPGKWYRLHAHVAQLGLPVRGEPSRWHGARPTLPDYLPAIGRHPGADNLYYAFGHQHLGLTLAATTGELVARLLDADDAPIDLAPFDLQRFA